jgi:hypothetical protein
MSLDVQEDGFELLVRTMKSKPAPLALLGAGTSVDSGYPDWTGLLAVLEERAQGKISPKYQNFLRTLNDPAWQAEEYRRLMGEHAFRGVIASQFAPKGRIGELLQTIAQLGFRHILTTNYDGTVEAAFERAGKQLRVIDWTEESNLRQFFLDLSKDGVDPYLLYLHGRYYDPGNVILTEGSYARRYVRSDDANRKLFAILITQPVIFIGFSVNDPDLNHLMREVNARLGVGDPQHFALMGYEVEEQREFIRNRLQSKFGILPVFYQITRESGVENHSELVVKLRELYRRVVGKDFVSAETVAASEENAAATATSVLEAAARVRVPEDPIDPQKGKWGGLPEANGRRLMVRNVQEHEAERWCSFDLVVERSGDAEKLEGDVVFHLHPTFPQSDLVVQAQRSKAICRLTAYGAFTVGVEADGGATRLELDLATLDILPEWFRAR